MEVTEESDAINEIRDLEIRLEKTLEESRRQAREIVKSARGKAAAMVSDKEKELSRAGSASAQEGYGMRDRETTPDLTGNKLDDAIVRRFADDLLKIIIR
ncbi:MAG: hypothetical protein ACE5EN_04025 [Nitrospinota bacterium]